MALGGDRLAALRSASTKFDETTAWTTRIASVLGGLGAVTIALAIAAALLLDATAVERVGILVSGATSGLTLLGFSAVITLLQRIARETFLTVRAIVQDDLAIEAQERRPPSP